MFGWAMSMSECKKFLHENIIVLLREVLQVILLFQGIVYT